MLTNTALLIAALIQIESSGRDYVTGDDGRAWGCLQIHAGVIQDVNRIAGTHYRHKDAFDRGKAIKICMTYLRHYTSRHRLGHKPTMKDMALCWNQGPNWYRKTPNEHYWRKVKRELDRLK